MHPPPPPPPRAVWGFLARLSGQAGKTAPPNCMLGSLIAVLWLWWFVLEASLELVSGILSEHGVKLLYHLPNWTTAKFSVTNLPYGAPAREFVSHSCVRFLDVNAPPQQKDQ